LLRKLAPLTAATALGALALAGGASAGNPAGAPNTACLHAGMAVLQDNGGVGYFARNGVPLSLIGGEGTAPLSTVLRLHLATPGLFPWC
jgi:hypothetical protein